VHRLERNAIVVRARTVTQTANAHVLGHRQQELLCVRIVRLCRADALHKQQGSPQKQQPLPQPLKEHCHERYTTLISAKTYLAEVPGSMHAVPRSSRLLRSQTAPNCRSTLGVEVFPGGTMAAMKFEGAA
jgi:hypothetical protein